MPQNLTEEQIKDIQEREAKALAYLKELELTPAASLSYQNIDGQDLFTTRVQPYLQDIKYSNPKPIISPFNQP